MQSIFEQLHPLWNEHTLYSDVGSTKGNVVEAIENSFGYLPSNFVPAHPIAGGEKSGVTAAKANLFENRRLILTPCSETSPVFVQSIRTFWESMGAVVSEMSVAHHDTVLAATSHLPHLLAFALVGMLGKKDEQQEIFKYAAGGFKDFTRIASSDPKMWQDICIANKAELIPLIQQFKSELNQFESILSDSDSVELFEKFNYSKNARQRFLDQHED
jgi:prephenate dehydrogenase